MTKIVKPEEQSKDQKIENSSRCMHFQWSGQESKDEHFFKDGESILVKVILHSDETNKQFICIATNN